jgi:hypothetical protein
VADLRFTRSYAEAHFGALYGVLEIIFAIVKTYLQNITENIKSAFVGK